MPKSASIAAAVPFESVQQLKTMAQDLNVVRQKLEQLTAAQQQMAQKIASLQALQQDIKQKESLPHSSPAVPVLLRKNEGTVAAAQAPRSICWTGGSATLAMAMSMCKVTATSIG